ncbi:MAG: hypothetical protein IKM55_01150 [Bacilli bacterium]|nr:hypothetical protein [Bacilli bacterium]
MKAKLTEEEIKDRIESKSYRTYDDLYQFDNITKQYQVDESGICFFDKDKNVVSMYKTDSVEETNTTIKKVIAVCDLGEEEIKKMDKVRHIIKGFLEICFRKKISVFLLSMAFIYMNIMGIKEKFYIMNLMYTWGFFMITDTSKAIRFIKETLEEYKLREEALVDKEFMEFYNTAIDDDMEDMKLYLMLSNTNEKRL